MALVLRLLGLVISSALGEFLVKILGIFGVSMITYVGIKPLYDNVTNKVITMLNIDSPEYFPIMEWLGVLRFDVCLSIVISAIGIKIVMMGLNASGGLTKMKLGGK